MSDLMMKLLGRVYMNEAETGAAGGGEATAASTTESAAEAAATTTLTPAATAAAAETATTETKTPEQIQQDADAAAKVKAETSAPEAYEDFTLPEGMEMDADVLGEFQSLAKELNIPQAKPQQLTDFQTHLAPKPAAQDHTAVPTHPRARA